MQKELLQEYQNRAFQAKTKEEWVSVLTEAKQACVGDENAYIYLKNYFTKILPRKKEYFEKYPPKEKRTYPTKITYLLQDELANTLNEYLKLLILEKKKQLNID